MTTDRSVEFVCSLLDHLVDVQANVVADCVPCKVFSSRVKGDLVNWTPGSTPGSIELHQHLAVVKQRMRRPGAKRGYPAAYKCLLRQLLPTLVRLYNANLTTLPWILPSDRGPNLVSRAHLSRRRAEIDVAEGIQRQIDLVCGQEGSTEATVVAFSGDTGR